MSPAMRPTCMSRRAGAGCLLGFVSFTWGSLPIRSRLLPTSAPEIFYIFLAATAPHNTHANLSKWKIGLCPGFYASYPPSAVPGTDWMLRRVPHWPGLKTPSKGTIDPVMREVNLQCTRITRSMNPGRLEERPFAASSRDLSNNTQTSGQYETDPTALIYINHPGQGRLLQLPIFDVDAAFVRMTSRTRHPFMPQLPDVYIRLPTPECSSDTLPVSFCLDRSQRKSMKFQQRDSSHVDPDAVTAPLAQSHGRPKHLYEGCGACGSYCLHPGSIADEEMQPLSEVPETIEGFQPWRTVSLGARFL
ncbi:uncharacterized protein MYCFIDRAFT_172139 [Pseudocercospora fijiensis CIRAD86]|uniref:Uncharacterized protein n=1 Tax=Pseudocercospora fijiensis (strain CIRAD86) TaxID=383855 RepID=M3BAN3_PSEFD|nr:uncharacterized protein MYCFIDRAFT_172139 [Pseudocercospora fijiensis CIRAD86]EME86372.1 hypothetical protein MYCFIDRAFT_172139 [Pseudocercospora fijiensis CIRAD86]